MKLNASPFAGVSFAMIVGVMGTALISPLYALYQAAWQLQTSDIARLYVVYMAGAMCSLLFLGRLADHAGFRPVMQWGLALALVGTFISMLAWNMPSLGLGRFIVGVASSLITTGATLGLAQLSRPGNVQRVAMVTGFLMAFGFGLGPLVGGVIGQWAPSPLVATYVPTLLLGGLGWLALRRLALPPSTPSTAPRPLRWQDVLPRLTWPQAHSSSAFVLTGCLSFLAFGVFGLYASMAPLFLDRLVPWQGPVVSGTAIAAILMTSALVQFIAGRMPVHWCGAGGLLSLAVSNVLLMVNLWRGSTVLFLGGVLFTAVGHGMCMLTGMAMMNRLATAGNRSGLFSTYLVIGYIGSMLPMMAIGWMADQWGMEVAVSVFCSLVIVLGTTAAVLFQRHPRMQPRRPAA